MNTKKKMLITEKTLDMLKEKHKNVKFFDIEGMEWVAAHSYEEVLKFYKEEMNIDLEEEQCDVQEIDPTKVYRINPETNVREPYLYALDQDLKDSRTTIPYLFASTEW